MAYVDAEHALDPQYAAKCGVNVNEMLISQPDTGEQALEIVDVLPDEVAGVVRAVLSETGHSQFVLAEVRAAVTASGKQRNRLTLWARRLLGEAITQAQFVLAEHDELADLVVSGTGGLGQLTEFFDRLQHTHAERISELGLS